jgi:hypothetical protein
MKVKIKEKKRTIVGTTGYKLIVHDVKSFDNSGRWLRLEAEEGYVLINPDNVLGIICEGERVR